MKTQGDEEWEDPSHVSSATVSIRIVAPNDHPPSFGAKGSFAVAVREDLGVGEKLARVEATDLDKVRMLFYYLLLLLFIYYLFIIFFLFISIYLFFYLIILLFIRIWGCGRRSRGWRPRIWIRWGK